MPEILKVERYSFKPDWTLSRYYINDVLHGFGVEDEMRNIKVKGETAIPTGTYELGYRESPKFSTTFYYNDTANKLITSKDYAALSSVEKKKWRPHDLIWVKNVPNFEYVLIHWGNTDDDTDGCYIVGNKVGVLDGQEGVVESRVNYMKLYPKLYPLVKSGKQYIKYTKAV